jgi:hypothetical protein
MLRKSAVYLILIPSSIGTATITLLKTTYLLLTTDTVHLSNPYTARRVSVCIVNCIIIQLLAHGCCKIGTETNTV